ncbi:hypothetical protein FOL47_003786 [Perkinsus chesapeaki]|uniref:Uncharacterized protein n=1 Tax=Perkinsus chesapeaki TaxID=330153 RepID=A0A7J6M7E4_PERCH|nr:hypothetical protein FOL47_003786 [Perkinsus chesapeaki]
MAIIASVCNGHPVGLFECIGDTSNGTVNFDKDVNKVGFDLTVLKCNLEVSDAPYKIIRYQHVLYYLRVNYTGTTLEEQVKRCGQPKKIILEGFSGIFYSHISGTPDRIEFQTGTGQWKGVCFNRN